MRYLIDTNIVIYYFNGLTADEALHDLLKESFRISVITKIEFLGWGEFSANPALYSQAKAFIRHATLYGLTEEIAEQTIQLRQQFRTKTPDAIIAATALVNGLEVVTRNTDDFSRLGIKTRAVTMKA
ncbi:type II toxin-antitoxin system VapC family toxin [Plasticicumulans sp.]|uniref:type II toxin-antitoxin system VapC family toxin n=1 Tax=Plasticicumulans sp. TaxID=2307179 RepID=UPI003924C02A|nr:type II toxin-antitoxin system VapC family toxin [Pseudomonadota bacterium]MBS0599636.1 type II toxin-antitoxin system VapC family toxin [Pseudomonadota bacterium]